MEKLEPNRAHSITHTLRILEEKGRAIPVTVKYDDAQGNTKETSTTVYVDAQAPVTPTPTTVVAKAPENPRPTVYMIIIKILSKV